MFAGRVKIVSHSSYNIEIFLSPDHIHQTYLMDIGGSTSEEMVKNTC